ncbi:MAG: hypothetical protein WCZ28_11355 [Burkholderiaceae bacterium]
MARPVEFAEANTLLLAPAGHEDSVAPLPVHRGDGCVVSCWQLSAEDLRRIAETGEIWLSVWGHTAPPVLVSGLKEHVI